MKKLFKDPALQTQFEHDGVLQLRILRDAQISELLEFYHSLGLEDDKGFGFYVSMDQRPSSCFPTPKSLPPVL